MSTVVTSELTQNVRRRATAAANKRQVAAAVFAALREAQIDPQQVSLDDMKSLVASAVIAANDRADRVA